MSPQQKGPHKKNYEIFPKAIWKSDHETFSTLYESNLSLSKFNQMLLCLSQSYDKQDWFNQCYIHFVIVLKAIKHVSRTLWSCGLIHLVVDWMVEGSNLAAAKSFFQFKSTKNIFTEVRAEGKGNTLKISPVWQFLLFVKSYLRHKLILHIIMKFDGSSLLQVLLSYTIQQYKYFFNLVLWIWRLE